MPCNIVLSSQDMQSEEMAVELFASPIAVFGHAEPVNQLFVCCGFVGGKPVIASAQVERATGREPYFHPQVRGTGVGAIEQVRFYRHFLGDTGYCAQKGSQ